MAYSLEGSSPFGGIVSAIAFALIFYSVLRVLTTINWSTVKSWFKKKEEPRLRGVQGAFVELLKPGLVKEFELAYERTGMYEVFLGVDEDPQMFMYLLLLTLADVDNINAHRQKK
jgi:hypothetical protein